MFKHILVPTDGSELSAKTIKQAILFAKSLGAETQITAFFAQPEYPTSYFAEGALIDPETPDEFSKNTNEQANKYLNDIAKEAANVGVKCNVVTKISDSPFRAIIEVAESEKCDLIFMASHGRRGLAGLLLGSETNRVLTHTKIPVLVYR